MPEPLNPLVRGLVLTLAAPVLAGLACTSTATTPHATPPAEAADAIYSGGDIVTLDDARPSAEALAVKDGRILALGSREEVERAHRGAATRSVDLAGATLLPGFLDAHSHFFSSLTVANQVNVYAPPAGPGKDPASIVAELLRFRAERAVPPGVLIQAYGYDENAMPDGSRLTRDPLDQAFPDNPVLVGHVSMHGAVLNSAALRKWNISAETPTPPGGIILRKPGSNEPEGLLMETAYLPIFASLPRPTAEQEVEWMRAGQRLYAAAGITTAHEGATHAEELEVMKRAAAGGADLIDVVAFPFITDLDAVLAANPLERWGKYENRLKIGGVKITVDGSPQAKTAYFTTPYVGGGPGGEPDWRGEPSFPEETVLQMVTRVHDLGVPLNLHANGDAAIDLFLRAYTLACGGRADEDWRVTVIHSQFVRPDQLDQYARLGITPSLYTLHTYYFAEAHSANRGREQAHFISPMRAALQRGLRPTNHTDFVVAPLDQPFMVWSAVNRLSRAGEVIGPDQRITPLEALRSMTLDVARQYGEESSKGSLVPGKLADLVILDRNPLEVDARELRDLRVLETLKEGETIYRAESGRPAR